MVTEVEDLMNIGNPFHNLGAATEKARSPLVFKCENVIKCQLYSI